MTEFNDTSSVLQFLKTRKSGSAKTMGVPGPSPEQLSEIMNIAVRAPDHGKLAPWRFILFEGDARAAFGDVLKARWHELHPEHGEQTLAFVQSMLLRAPTIVAVVSTASPNPKIPEWEQVLSSAAVCYNMVLAATALGFAAQWQSDWLTYDSSTLKAMGVGQTEKVAGLIYIGTATAPLEERPRPRPCRYHDALGALMSIKAILFDKDGTLIDLDGTWVPIYKEFLAREKAEGHEHSIELMRQAGYDPDTERFLPNTILSSGTTKQLVQLWWPELDDDGINHKIATLDRDYADIALAHIKPILPLSPFLERLEGQGFKVGVGTNDTYLSAVTQLKHLGIADRFDLILGADSVAVPKPSGDMIRHFAKSLGLPTSAIAMVGDNHHDLEEARAGGAGLAIGVLSGSGLREHLEPYADHIIGSIADLPALLGG